MSAMLFWQRVHDFGRNHMLLYTYIYILQVAYILDPRPPHPGCQTMLQLHYIFRIGKPMILATVSGWGVHPIYDILCIDFFIHNKVKLIDS